MAFLIPLVLLAASLVSAVPVDHAPLAKRCGYDAATAPLIQGFDLDFTTNPPKQPYSVLASNHSFMYAQTTWGMKLSDVNWAKTKADARAAGLITGGIHHPWPADGTGAAQATFFTNNGGKWTPDGKTLPGVLTLDFLHDDGNAQLNCAGLNSSTWPAWINDFVTKYKALNSGRAPVIQTGYSWSYYCLGIWDKYTMSNDLWNLGAPNTGWDAWKFKRYMGPTGGWNSTGVNENWFGGNLTALNAYVL